ncbi:hypothetical protein R1sor_021665 [Riccia sorocarpa]|uniref:Late embryogenesis abundant protein LEA-2 subgroup domain-containing protein n=1 Tax=Riccia sorocarpa TaxID=122646 RepID=A0ABD3GNF9_9MARC
MGERYVYPNAANNAPPAPPAYSTVTVGNEGPGGSLPNLDFYPAPKRKRSCSCLWLWMCSLLPDLDRYRALSRKLNCFLCLYFSMCGLIVVVFIVIIMVVVLVIRPKLPKYDVTDVRLTGLNDSVGTGQLNTGLSFTLDTYNPNKKMGFHYEEIYIQVEMLGLVTGEGQIPPFYHGHHNRTIVSTTLKSKQVPLTTDNKNKLLQASNDNKLLLHVTMYVKTRFRPGGLGELETMDVEVRCNVEINPFKTGNQVLNENCKVPNFI